MWGTDMAGPTGTTENKSATTASTAPSAPASVAPSSSAPSTSPSTANPSTAAAKAGSALASLEKVAAAAGQSTSPSAPEGASSASSTAATAAGSPGTTEAAREPATAAGQPSAHPEAPQSRIEAATRNARAQGKQDVETEIGWVRELGDRESVEEAVSLIRYARSSRQAALEFYEQLGQELGLAGGSPASTSDVPAPKPFTLPKAKLVAEDGTGAYSESQLADILKDFRADVLREVQTTLKPTIDFAKHGQEEQARTEMRMAAATDAKSVLAAARELPHFTEHEKIISEELNRIPKSLRMKVGSVAALYMAYNKVLTERVLPLLKQNGGQEAIDDLRRSAVAGASTVGTTTSAAPKAPILRDGNVTDLAAHMARIAAQQSA